MRNKVFAVVLSAALALSMTACGEKAEDAQNVSAESQVQETAGTETESVSAETVAETVAETAAETADETEAVVSAPTMDAEGNMVMSYEFGTATISEDNATIVPTDAVDVNTALYKDKTLGELCDYLEAEVMEEGSGLNRDFLCEMVAVSVMDPELMTSYQDYKEALTYALSLAEECNGISVDLMDLSLDFAEDNEDKEYLHVFFAGAEDVWVLDTAEDSLAMNNGTVNIDTPVLETEHLSAWEKALDEFYGEA